MLLSLQTGLHNELKSSISKLSNRLECVEEHTEHLESQIGVMVKPHDEMVDEEQAEVIHKLELKLEDLEDNFHHNNINLRRISNRSNKAIHSLICIGCF